MSPPNKQFNVLLSTKDRNQLNTIAQQNHTDAATTIRQLIGAAYSHIVLQSPTCPTNQPCYVPQMHPRRNVPVGDTQP